MEDFSRDQERVNALTHFIAAGIGLCLTPLLVVKVYTASFTDNVQLAGALIYSLGFVMVFLISALYHYYDKPRLKNRFEKWDHVGIFFMIAGTYTPFLLAYASPDDKAWMLTVIWTTAFAGSVFKFLNPSGYRIPSMLIYVLMGWLMLGAPASFREAIPSALMGWIIAGALLYIFGLAFYVKAFFRHHHAVWHLFVLGGALCHYIGIVSIYA